MSTFVPPRTDSTAARPPDLELNHSPSSGFQSVYPSVIPPMGGHLSGSGDGTHVNPSVVVTVVILSVVFILSGFLHLLARCLRRRCQRAPRQHGPLQHLFHLHDAGVEQFFIDKLPVFVYRSIRGLKDSADCAVCLNEFGDDDRLLLLPKCKHTFHLVCIEKWLLSNSTCPLCRRSLLPDLHVHSAASKSHHRHGELFDAEIASASDMIHSNRFICPEEQLTISRSRRIINSLHGSIHGSFRMCDALTPDRNSENEIQEIVQEIEEMNRHVETPSPFAPTIRVMDEHGTQQVLKVELGKEAGRVTSQSDSRKLTRNGARSYSMGSYEYIVDPSSCEHIIAPTDWAPPSKPTHRSALSDSIPELASAGATPANDDLLWTRRSLYTPHTLSRVQDLLTPIRSDSTARSSPFLDSSYSPGQGDRWIDIDIERGEVIEGNPNPKPQNTRFSTTSSSCSSAVLEVVIGNDSLSDFKQRSSSLSRMPEGSQEKKSVSCVRRSLSETSAGMEQAVSALAAKPGGDCSNSLICDGSVRHGSFSRKFSLIVRHWVMGRNKRIVFSAALPSPVSVVAN